MGPREDIKQRLANLLSKDDDVELAILFGSLASGEGRADSDVDVAVLTKSSLDGPRKRALIASIGALTGRPVDLIDLKNAGADLVHVALHTGKRLVCRESRLWADLVARNLIDAADFLPYRERLMRERRHAWIR